MALTNAQKDALAGEMIIRVADMIEFRTEIITDPALADVPTPELARQLSVWLSKLPGDVWDHRLDIHKINREGS